jgi:hypothetical protein
MTDYYSVSIGMLYQIEQLEASQKRLQTVAWTSMLRHYRNIEAPCDHGFPLDLEAPRSAVASPELMWPAVRQLMGVDIKPWLHISARVEGGIQPTGRGQVIKRPAARSLPGCGRGQGVSI